MQPVGTFTNITELMTLLRQRQVELELSNEALGALCGIDGSNIDKYLGPAQRKSPTAITVETLMTALGLSGTLFVDTRKTLWKNERRRQGAYVHPPPRLSKVIVQKARPVVLGDLARKAAAARWKRTTPEQRQAIGKHLAEARAKARAGT